MKRSTIAKAIFIPAPIFIVTGGLLEIVWLMWLGISLLAILVVICFISLFTPVKIFGEDWTT